MGNSQEGGGGSAKQAEDDRSLMDLGNSESPVAQIQTMDEELWTAEEMEQAEPCDIIEVSDAALKKVEEEKFTQAEEGGMFAESGEPELDAEDDFEEQATSGGYNYPPPYTRYEVFDSYKVYPYRCVGKLFFKRNGKSYVCSASSIGGDAIWTAGHCLHAGNNKASGWATNVVFVPAYKDGAAPFGQWHVKRMWVRTSWYKHGIPKGLAQDMGGGIVYKRNGKRLSQVVGWLGFAWNFSKYQHWTQFGYPAAAPFNGKRLITCTSSYAYHGSVGASPKPIGVGSDLTGGSSGGPWIMRFATGNYVNGLNSYRRSSKKHEMYSPYFNNNAKSLYNLLKSQKS
ncbi:hypothetical protein OE749_06495 [Aestuariibacter sp. AA17]|uniref:Serine protease n=1 Tax=Fluctibacter corallii TaxID=2984329 RepID=A0ABT3A6L7_9ALTE|nr:hypothetical protein [Aestuariibacter sp. AA17]MCV2884339.1 hypothetical protein [Aestuariibacter sp. AA17]